ncbi:MAG TPA: hypothetical protein VGG03_14680 [Thermoanaerobaculia bacterium]|jgi:flagellar biosynthesis/type III secretory pathway protein FliH
MDPDLEKEEGFNEGREQGLEEGRAALLRELERRFGPLPEPVRQRVVSLDSISKIVELSTAAATAPSLAALGLSGARNIIEHRCLGRPD